MNYNINLPNWLKPVTSKNLIRVGRKNDGGYLVQKDQIINKKILISFGINDDWSFENDFLNLNNNAEIYLFDRSVSFLQLIKLFLKNIFHIPNLLPLLNSIKAIFSYHLFFNKNNVNFFPFFVGREIKNESKSLIECFDLIKGDVKEFVVKIDIEGSEYRILSDIIKLKDSIDVLVIEFHDIDLHLYNIEKFIIDFNFHITHLHVNNYSDPDINGTPKDIEITFQKFATIEDNSNTKYPLSIDMPSNNLKPDVNINWI
jgi:hypothetical protein